MKKCDILPLRTEDGGNKPKGTLPMLCLDFYQVLYLVSIWLMFFMNRKRQNPRHKKSNRPKR